MSSPSRRLIWADALRGFLILTLVLGHCLQHGDFENRIIWNVIYSFHMATFFVISGYVGFKKEYEISSLWTKSRHLLFPFLAWTVIEVCIRGGGISGFANVLTHPDTSYWFVYVLFVIFFLFTLITIVSKIIKLRNDYLLWGWVFLLILAMVLTEFRLFGFQFIALYFGFYVLGYTLKKYKVRFSPSRVIGLGILWIAMALFWKMHSVPEPLQFMCYYIPASLLTYGYRYITALLGSLFFVGFAMRKMNTDNMVCRLLAYFGKISLGIYIVHLFLTKFVEPLYIGYFPSDTCLLFIISDFFLKLIISILIIQVIQRVPIARLLLLGMK